MSSYVSGSQFAVVGGEDYLASFQTERDGGSGQYDPRGALQWYDADGAVISSTALQPGICTGGGVKSHSQEITAPTGARKARMRYSTYSGCHATQYLCRAVRRHGGHLSAQINAPEV